MTGSEAWLTRLACRWFAAFLLAYGLAALFSPDNRLPASGITDLAEGLGIAPHVLLGITFLIPGGIMLPRRSARFGLLIAIVCLSFFEVGLIWSAVRGTGTTTGPVLIFFVLAFAAGLLWVIDETEGRH